MGTLVAEQKVCGPIKDPAEQQVTRRSFCGVQGFWESVERETDLSLRVKAVLLFSYLKINII